MEKLYLFSECETIWGKQKKKKKRHFFSTNGWCQNWLQASLLSSCIYMVSRDLSGYECWFLTSEFKVEDGTNHHGSWKWNGLSFCPPWLQAEAWREKKSRCNSVFLWLKKEKENVLGTVEMAQWVKKSTCLLSLVAWDQFPETTWKVEGDNQCHQVVLSFP